MRSTQVSHRIDCSQQTRNRTLPITKKEFVSVVLSLGWNKGLVWVWSIYPTHSRDVNFSRNSANFDENLCLSLIYWSCVAPRAWLPSVVPETENNILVCGYVRFAIWVHSGWPTVERASRRSIDTSKMHNYAVQCSSVRYPRAKQH